MDKFSASEEDSETKIKKKRSKFKQHEENGKKRHKKNSSLYYSLHGKNKSHTSRECKLIKARNKDKYNPKYATKYYKRKSTEVNLLEREAAHQRAKYLKYKKLNKNFAKKKTPNEETIILYDNSDSDSSSSNEAYNSLDEYEKASIA